MFTLISDALDSPVSTTSGGWGGEDASTSSIIPIQACYHRGEGLQAPRSERMVPRTVVSKWQEAGLRPCFGNAHVLCVSVRPHPLGFQCDDDIVNLVRSYEDTPRRNVARTLEMTWRLNGRAQIATVLW